MDLSTPHVTGLAMLLALGLAVAWVAGVVAVWWTLTRPSRRTAAWAVSRGLASDPGEMDMARYGTGARAWTTWELRHDGARCPVWELAGDAPGGPTAILTHGWNDSKLGGLVRLEPFLACCSRVLLWDMPGHGEASGRSDLGRSEGALLDELIARTTGPVVLMGWSMGGGVSLECASGAQASRIIGVLCEAPYALPGTPARRVMRAQGLHAGALGGLGLVGAALTLIGGRAWQSPGGPFDRTRWTTRVRCPLMIVHGTDDPVSPLADGRAIATAADRAGVRTLLLELEGGRHNDLWITPALRARLTVQVRAWLEGLAATAAGSRATAPRP
jgi:pimeloyl-ACP methyl ester carboxylesterase